MRTLAAIKQDFETYQKLAKKQHGITLYAEKYVEDVGALLVMLAPQSTPKPSPEEVPAVVEDNRSNNRRTLRKAKTP